MTRKALKPPECLIPTLQSDRDLSRFDKCEEWHVEEYDGTGGNEWDASF